MFGFDERLAHLSDGESLWIVLLVAVLLGLRHATDPDHVAAVTTLVAAGRERAARAGARLGLAWGFGHGLTVFAFGLPIVVLDRHLPERAVQAAETVIAVVIASLALRLIVRWRRGLFHAHGHEHTGVAHAHAHAHRDGDHDAHGHGSRGPLGAFGIGLVHGLGGSAGVGVLVVAAVNSTRLAVVSLLLLAVFTAVSMTLLTSGFGRAIVSRPARAVLGGAAPALGAASLAFGIWYGSAAWNLLPYPF